MIRIELSGKQAPSEMRLFRRGKNSTRKGTFVFDDAAAKSVMQAFAEHKAKIAFDYDHGSTARAAIDPSLAGKAAGRCDLAVRNGELWAVNIKWTESAQRAIEAGEWMYVSPTFAQEDGRVLQVLAVAITNIPATDDPMPLIELAMEAPLEELAEWTTEYVNDLPDSAFLWIAPGGEKDEQDKTVPRESRKLPIYDAEGKLDLPHLRNALARIEQTEGPSDEEKAALIAKAQELLDEATEEPEAEKAPEVVEEKDCKPEQLSEVVPESTEPEALSAAPVVETSKLVELTGADTEELALGVLAAWRESHEQLSIVRGQLEELKQAHEKLEREVLLKDNAAKIPGKLGEWAANQSTETLKAYFASAPDIVPTKHLAQPAVEKVVSLSDEERAVAKAFGISEDRALAYKQRNLT